MTEKEALARINQMYQASPIEDPEECLDDVLDQLIRKAQSVTSGQEDEAIEAFSILSVFADESERQKARQFVSEHEETLAFVLLEGARHQNIDVRKAALRALEHIRRSEKEHGK